MPKMTPSEFISYFIGPDTFVDTLDVCTGEICSLGTPREARILNKDVFEHSQVVGIDYLPEGIRIYIEK